VSTAPSAPQVSTPENVRDISIAHSPDSDDAFMFYGLATNKVRVPGYRFSHVLCDIETLNHRAIHEAFFDVTAISFHAYPYLQDNYALMACGGSVGENYGPMIIAPQRYTLDEVKKLKIAIPGTLTTAFLALRLFAPEIETEVVPFDQIIPQVLAGKYRAGLIIHEGQLTYGNNGLHKILDLGVWWREQTGMPLPLGGNAIKRSLGPEAMRVTTQALRESIQHGLDHRESALQYAMQFARDLDPGLADKFVGMYVNERTLDYGKDGRAAIEALLKMGHERGIIPQVAKIDWID
jgi:1,4-dihydroxy-6-naphthoate synthase